MATVRGRSLLFLVSIALAAAGFLLDKAAAPVAGRALVDAGNGAMGDWLLGASQPGRWLMFLGFLLLGTTAASGWLAQERRGGWIGGLLLASTLATIVLRELALSGKCHEIPGIGRAWSLDDDMMITLRYAWNLAHGDGLTWNPGERIEGITNLLWALVLAVPCMFLPLPSAASAAIVLNGALLVAVIALAAGLVRRLGGSSLAATLAAVALATHQPTLHWAAAGSESILLAALLLVVAHAAVRVAASEAVSERSVLRACAAAGLAWTTRPDALPALAPLLFVLIVPALRAPGTRAAGWKRAAAFAALPAAATLFRLAYYGTYAPNTYWLKMTGFPGRTLAGFDYLLRLLSQHAIFVAFALAALLAARRRAAGALLAAVGLHLAWVVWAGGDELPKQRFVVAIAPLLLALAFTGAEQLAHRIGGAAGPVVRCADVSCQPVWIPFALLALGGLGGGLAPGIEDPGGERRARAERAMVMLGSLIRANTEPDARIAHFWAGTTAYFAQRPALDLLGKCDPVIARQEAKPGLMRPGHNKWDFAHSLALEPDVVVGGLGGGMTLAELGSYARESHYRAFADLYRESRFASEYVGAAPGDVGNVERMPQLVGGAATRLPPEWADISRSFHALFVRRGSTRARAPAQWEAPTGEDLR